MKTLKQNASLCIVPVLMTTSWAGSIDPAAPMQSIRFFMPYPRSPEQEEALLVERILLHLLQIALLDLLHHGFAAKQIFFELHRNLARHDE